MPLGLALQLKSELDQAADGFGSPRHIGLSADIRHVHYAEVEIAEGGAAQPASSIIGVPVWGSFAPPQRP